MYFQSTFAVKKITNFEQLEGLSEWKSQARDMVLGARWRFDANGVFVYAPAHGRKEIFPLQGNYVIEDNKVCFTAKTVFFSTSAIATWCSGKIDLSSNSRTIYMDWGNDCSTAGMVADSLFDSHRRSLYRFTIVLRQVI